MGILSKVLDPIFGADTSSQDAAAQAALDKSSAAYDNLSAPNISAPDVIPYQDLGGISAPKDISYELGDPRLSQATNQGSSAYGDITTDPRLAGAQNAALSSLDDIIKVGGFNAQDKANLARIQSDTAQADKGRRDAILQAQAAKGMSGSGNELLALLNSSQAATDRASQQGLDVAGQGQQRALDAIMQSGNLAGNMRSQQFGQDAQIAAAKDAIARFNASNSTQNNQFNTGALNNFATARAAGNMSAANSNVNNAMEANKFNAGNSQNVSNLNNSALNSQAQAQAAIPQQNFENERAIAAGKSGAALPAVNYYQGQGDREAAKNAGYMNAAIQGGTAAATYGAKK